MAEKQVHNVFFKTDHSSRASQISFDLPSGDGVKLSTGTGHIGLLGGGVVRIKTNQSSGVLDLGVNTLENAKPDTTILGKTFSLKAADHNANFSGKKEVDNIIYFPWNNESSDYYCGRGPWYT